MNTFLRLYLNIPVITRLYMTGVILVTLAANSEFMITQYQIYLNPRLIIERFQYWRLLTTFLYAGQGGFGTLFTILFSYRYSRILEEGIGPRHSADFLFMYIFLGWVMLALALLFTDIIFLGHSFSHAILYILCRRNPNQRVMILGIIVIPADYVPMFLISLSLLTQQSLGSDLVSLAAGHSYYFLNDVFPNQPSGFKIMKTPQFLKMIFNELDADPERNTSPAEDPVRVDENNAAAGGDQGVAPPPLVEDVNAVDGNQFPLN